MRDGRNISKDLIGGTAIMLAGFTLGERSRDATDPKILQDPLIQALPLKRFGLNDEDLTTLTFARDDVRQLLRGADPIHAISIGQIKDGGSIVYIFGYDPARPMSGIYSVTKLNKIFYWKGEIGIATGVALSFMQVGLPGNIYDYRFNQSVKLPQDAYHISLKERLKLGIKLKRD